MRRLKDEIDLNVEVDLAALNFLVKEVTPSILISCLCAERRKKEYDVMYVYEGIVICCKVDSMLCTRIL